MSRLRADPPERPAPVAKPRILVVDDEPSMREMLRIVLRRDGYDVVIAQNGTDGMERLRTEPFDLLLSDIRMPDISGVEVLRAAKQINPDILAFMMTAFASTDTAVEAMRLGALDYFTKPFSMDELRLKIRQHLEAKRLKQENLLLKRALNSRHEFSSILGRSDAMQVVFSTIQTVANTTQHRADQRRVGHRQGAGGAGDSFQLAAARSSVRRGQLRRRPRNAARVGAVRPRARRLHRRAHEQEGADGGRGRRDASSSTKSARWRRRCR